MKRIRVISLAVIAALSLTVTSFAAEKSPQQSAAAYLSEAGIMLGNESGDMMLEQGLTRAQMAALLTRIVTDPEQFETDSAFYRSLCSFTDVPEWAKSYVGYCVANNLVAGYGNGRYGSNDPVTSAAACTVMLRCLNDVDAVWDYQSACRTAVQLGLAAEETVADAEISPIRQESRSASAAAAPTLKGTAPNRHPDPAGTAAGVPSASQSRQTVRPSAPSAKSSAQPGKKAVSTTAALKGSVKADGDVKPSRKQRGKKHG